MFLVNLQFGKWKVRYFLPLWALLLSVPPLLSEVPFVGKGFWGLSVGGASLNGKRADNVTGSSGMLLKDDPAESFTSWGAQSTYVLDIHTRGSSPCSLWIFTRSKMTTLIQTKARNLRVASAL